jgi:hypothetical protein
VVVFPVTGFEYQSYLFDLQVFLFHCDRSPALSFLQFKSKASLGELLIDFLIEPIKGGGAV